MNPGTIRIASERLVVEVGWPGEGYRRGRFDWTGWVRQVTLDGRHTFCVDECLEPGKGSGGRGLCNEFGIETPIGYAEAAPGESFPKLGVGLLQRLDDQPYSFVGPYPVTPFPVDVEADADTVRFEVHPLPTRGYAARLFKEVRVAGPRLTIRSRLRNEGRLPLRTDEYNHNFVAVDGQPLGPGYRLNFNFPLAPERVPPCLRIEGAQVDWLHTPAGALYFRCPAPTPPVPAVWDLEHLASGAGIRCTDDFPLARLAVWGPSHAISPETFMAIDLAPGAEVTWTRQWEFRG